ncbi:MAG: ornithine cyclodeaminase [Pseudomonadota bacterium]
MSAIPVITRAEVEHKLSWSAVCDAMEAAHCGPAAQIEDILIEQGAGKMLSRAAWVPGIGFGVKTASIVPENATRGLPTVQGAMLFFDEETGTPRALIENALITKWKTAADSVLGARFLARKSAERLLIIGAGDVCASLIEAYPAVLPGITTIEVWNRTPARAEAVCEGTIATPVTDLPNAVAAADIIATATLSSEPVLLGDWLRPGQHVDLIGAFTPTMREADDAVLRRGNLFVDSRATTLEHIGELKIPLADGVITTSDVLGDFAEMAQGKAGRRSEDEITVFKNGGGAHLDLITAKVILDAL